MRAVPVVMADHARVDLARTLLQHAIAGRIFPSAVAETGDSTGVLWREPFGRVTFDEDSPAADISTIYDLASLTKPIATTPVVLQLVSAQRMELDEPVSACFAEWRGPDRECATVRDLLEHAAGLPGRLVDQPPQGRREFEHEICRMPLEYAPRTTSIYSDLGFILLGFTVEDRGGAPLATQFEAIRMRLNAATGETAVGSHDHGRDRGDARGVLSFTVSEVVRSRVAPTLPLADDTRRGSVLTGAVHDNYAAALGGVAGHSGLFGNVAGVGAFGRAILRGAREDTSLFPPFTYPWVMAMARKSTVPGSSRGLGWDTMLPTSSCGAGMSFAAFGHVGYTGTSLWIDPILDRYFVLLTNRACGGGTLDQMREVRRAFHDALVRL